MRHVAPSSRRRLVIRSSGSNLFQSATSTTASHLFRRGVSPTTRFNANSATSPFFSTLAITPEEPSSVTIMTDKDELMAEIRIATQENIDDILNSAEPGLKRTWDKIMKRLELHKRIPKKKARRVDTTPDLRLASTTSLDDLLNTPIEDEFGAAAASSMSLTDMLDQIVEDEGLTRSSDDDATASLLDRLDQPTTIDEELVEDALLGANFDAPADLGYRVEEDLLLDIQSSVSPTDASLMELLEDNDSSTPADDLTAKENDEFGAPTSVGAETVAEPTDSSESLMDLLMDDSSFGVMRDEPEYSPAQPISSYAATTPSLSDLLDSDDNNEWLLDNRNDSPAEDPESYSSIMSRGIALLASMSDYQWRLLDEDGAEKKPEQEEMYEDVEEEEFIVIDDEVDGLDIPEDALLATNDVLEGKEDSDGVEHSNEVLIKLEGLLGELFADNVSLTTEEFNLILLQLASTSDYANDDAIDMLMQVYTYMAPSDRDGYTHAIMIPALVRRGQAPIAASQMIFDMVDDDDYMFDNTETLVQAMMCLERCKRLDQAEQLIQKVMANQEDRITVPVQALVPLMRMYKSEQKMDKAMDMIDDFIQEAGIGHHLNDIFSEAMSWPRWNGQGERVDISTLHTFVFNKLKYFEREKSSRAKPRDKIWKGLVVELAKSAPKGGTSTETELIQEILWLMLKRNPNYWPDDFLLKYGLEMAVRHDDSKLAVELLQRLLMKPVSRMDQLTFDTEEEEEVEEEERPAPALIPPQAFLLAMQTCLSAKDSTSVTTLLTLVDHPDVNVPPPVHLQSMNQAVRVFASDANWLEARATLTAMNDRGLVPSDEAFGAVIHTLAMAQRPAEALELFVEMGSGKFGDIQPGVLSFNAKMLALMQTKSWQEVIDLQEEMKSAGLAPTSVAFHGVILASMKLGNEASVLEAIENATKSKISLNQSCFEQSLKCLFPDLVADQGSIAEIRLRLREHVDAASDSTLGKAYLNLSRSLRVAEVEEEREKSRSVRQEEIDRRRQSAWEQAHTSLVQLYRAAR